MEYDPLLPQSHSIANAEEAAGLCPGCRRPRGYIHASIGSGCVWVDCPLYFAKDCVRGKMESFNKEYGGDTLQYQVIGNESHGISVEEAAQKIKVMQAKPGDAGIDLYACFAGVLHIAPGHTGVVPCGIAVKVPDGCVGFMKARSSTVRQHGLMVVENTIDSGYTGPLFVTLYNPGLDGRTSPVVIKPWDRLVQLVVVPYYQCQPVRVEQMPKTDRGSTGYGSTGR